MLGGPWSCPLSFARSRIPHPAEPASATQLPQPRAKHLSRTERPSSILFDRVLHEMGVTNGQIARDWAVDEQLRDELSAPAVKAAPVVDLTARRTKLADRRARILSGYEEGLYSREELRTHLAKVDADRTKLEALEHVTPTATPSARREMLRRVGAIGRAWGRAPGETRRAIVRELVASVGLAVGMPPVFEWRTVEALNAEEG